MHHLRVYGNHLNIFLHKMLDFCQKYGIVAANLFIIKTLLGMNLGQELWQLTMVTQNLERLDNEELFEAYKRAYALHYHSQEDGVSETERQWATKLFEDVQFEARRRHLTIVAVFVSMDQNGNFVCGREELKQIFSRMSFDEMVELADQLCGDCENEKQRQAIIDLERELVTMAN